MPLKKQPNLRVKYYSARFQAKLGSLLNAKTAYVEAPAGYGKTTAVHEALSRKGERSIWFTALAGETAARSWARFCRQLARIDAATGARLQALGLPDADTIGEAAEALAEIVCEESVYLVLDNLHHWARALPGDILTALAGHGGEGLHLVIIAQPVGEQPRLLGDGGVLRMGKADFALTPEDILAYFHSAGAAISPAQAAAVWESTEGWIAAVYLELLHYDNTRGIVSAGQDIYALMREVVWERLDGEARRLLLLLSPFSCFTRQQLLFMAQVKELPPGGRSALGGMGFIRYDQRQGIYYPHTILLELLRELFQEQGETYQKQVWARAGQWNEAAGDKLCAVECYCRARDFERLYALDLSDVELNTAGEGRAAAAVEDMIASCPRDVKLRYPLSLLSLAYELFAAARHEQFLRLCGEIEALIPQTAFDRREQDRLLGELALLRSFAAYNDIRRMSEQHQLAHALIGGHSRLVDGSVPWTMGCPSVLYMFHRNAGELDAELTCMERCLPLYQELAQGHGSGADLLMRAEALHLRGSRDEADILALRAAYAARSRGQNSLLLCAEFLSARIALAAGNEGAFRAAAMSMEQSVEGGPPSLHAALDMAGGHLQLTLHRPQAAARWIREGDFAARGLLAPAVPYAQMLHLYCCLEQKDYRRLYGLAEPFLAQAGQQHALVCALYIRILLACACHRENKAAQARDHLRRAQELALPDGVIAPFAEFAGDTLPLLACMPGAAGEKMGAVRALAMDLKRGRDALGQALFSEKNHWGLTQREHEIALMAARRRSNQEIAQATSLSVATVRTHLQTVYGKMGIDSRSRNKRSLLEQRFDL